MTQRIGADQACPLRVTSRHLGERHLCPPRAKTGHIPPGRQQAAGTSTKGDSRPTATHSWAWSPEGSLELRHGKIQKSAHLLIGSVTNDTTAPTARAGSPQSRHRSASPFGAERFKLTVRGDDCLVPESCAGGG